MKTSLQLTVCLFALTIPLLAQEVSPGEDSERAVTSIRMAGPYPTAKPLMTDSLDSEGNRIDLDNVFMDAYAAPIHTSSPMVELPFVLSPAGEQEGDCGSVYLAGLTLQNTGFAKGKINVKCESKHKLFIDGNEQGGDFELVPGRHEVSIKLLVKHYPKEEDGGGFDTLRISVESEQSIEVNPEGKRYWTNADMMHGERISGVDLSSSGKYVHINKRITYKGGESEGKNIFIELATGKEFCLDGFERWLPKDDRYLRSYRDKDGTRCYESVDVGTGESTFIGKYKGNGYAHLTRDLKHFLVTVEEKEAEEKNKDVHQILEPDDRQPGWRKRRNYSLYDIETGITTPITKGAANVYVTPIRTTSRNAPSTSSTCFCLT